MKIPVKLFLDGIGAKKIYYFSSTKINTDVPHYYICIKRTDDDVLILSCCTSQFDTVQRFVETRSLPPETLVYIAPTATNNFTKQTFVNCNEYHTSTLDEFKTLYESESIDLSGEIADIHYEQILIGLHASTLIAEDAKELIPNPSSL